MAAKKKGVVAKAGEALEPVKDAISAGAAYVGDAAKAVAGTLGVNGSEPSGGSKKAAKPKAKATGAATAKKAVAKPKVSAAAKASKPKATADSKSKPTAKATAAKPKAAAAKKPAAKPAAKASASKPKAAKKSSGK